MQAKPLSENLDLDFFKTQDLLELSTPKHEIVCTEHKFIN